MGTFYLIPGDLLGFLPDGKAAPIRMNPNPHRREPNYYIRPEWRHFREEALDAVDAVLDEMCTEMGLDPHTTWRLPRASEIEQERWRREMDIRLSAMISTGIVDANQIAKITYVG